VKAESRISPGTNPERPAQDTVRHRKTPSLRSSILKGIRADDRHGAPGLFVPSPGCPRRGWVKGAKPLVAGIIGRETQGIAWNFADFRGPMQSQRSLNASALRGGQSSPGTITVTHGLRSSSGPQTAFSRTGLGDSSRFNTSTSKRMVLPGPPPRCVAQHRQHVPQPTGLVLAGHARRDFHRCGPGGCAQGDRKAKSRFPGRFANVN